jgi:hypothetical protein
MAGYVNSQFWLQRKKYNFESFPQIDENRIFHAYHWAVCHLSQNYAVTMAGRGYRQKFLHAVYSDDFAR